MTCLTDAQIQAIVDNEAAEAIHAHAASCTRCRERIRERQRLMTSIVQDMNAGGDMPSDVRRRVSDALADSASRGATRLRPVDTRPAFWRPAVWSGGIAIAAATLIAVVFVAPMFKERSTVSASEILAKSAVRLAQRLNAGVEFLEYELTLDGVPREMMPDHVDGAYRVKQVIDHDSKGRYFVATYAPDGQMLSAVAQDPASHTRVMSVRLENQPYRFEVSVPGDVALSPPEVERLHMEACVAMMRASGNQQLQVIDTGAGRQYRIDVPQVSAETPNAVWDLSEARVVIDADDYHIVEFAVKGAFLKQPYSVSYRLIRRTIESRTAVSESEFEVPLEPGAVTIRGDGSAVPARDVVVLALRELARARVR
jgi:hypothetical protein